jgi:hypothetical protein
MAVRKWFKFVMRVFAHELLAWSGQLIRGTMGLPTQGGVDRPLRPRQRSRTAPKNITGPSDQASGKWKSLPCAAIKLSLSQRSARWQL